METLFEMLKAIIERLEQILQITENQKSILVRELHDDSGMGLLEEMAKYKEDLTDEVEEIEKKFQQCYDQVKGQVAELGAGKELRNNVEAILKLKEQVIATEQCNVMLMKESLRKCAQTIKIEPNANAVIGAYKTQEAFKKEKE